MSALRVLACGGRDYLGTPWNVLAVCIALQELPLSAVLVHGAANGADTLAADVWTRWGHTAEAHPADWKRYGKQAGPIRNREMLDSGIDLVIAFPGGRGTAHMVSIARAAGIPVRVVAGWDADSDPVTPA